MYTVLSFQLNTPLLIQMTPAAGMNNSFYEVQCAESRKPSLASEDLYLL